MLFVAVVNRRNTWIRQPGKAIVSPSKAAEQDSAWPPLFQRLHCLLRSNENPDESLVSGEMEIIDGRPADCIVTMRAGHATDKMCFDTHTHHLRRLVKYRVPDFSDPPKSLERFVTIEATFDDFKTFDGVVVPSRTVVTQDQRRLYEETVTAIEFFKSLDDRLFKSPDKDRSQDLDKKQR